MMKSHKIKCTTSKKASKIQIEQTSSQLCFSKLLFCIETRKNRIIKTRKICYKIICCFEATISSSIESLASSLKALVMVAKQFATLRRVSFFKVWWLLLLFFITAFLSSHFEEVLQWIANAPVSRLTHFSEGPLHFLVLQSAHAPRWFLKQAWLVRSSALR